MSKVVDTNEIILKELSEKIGSDWEKLARYLNITEGDLFHIREKCHHTHEICFQMLLFWRKRNGNSATKKQLSEALLQIGRKDLYNVIHADSSQPGTSGRTFQTGAKRDTGRSKRTTLPIQLTPFGFQTKKPKEQFYVIEKIWPGGMKIGPPVTFGGQGYTTFDDLKNKSGFEDWSGESADEDTNSRRPQPEEEQRHRQEPEDSGANYRDEDGTTETCEEQCVKQLSVMQFQLEEMQNTLRKKENELKETKAKLRAAEEQLATYQQQYGKQTAGLAVDLETSNKTLNTTRNDPNFRGEASTIIKDGTNDGGEQSGRKRNSNEVSQEDMSMLSKGLGSSWRTIARALGFAEPDIDNLKEDHGTQEERSYQMLLRWTREHASKATYQDLAIALIKGKRRDLADKLKLKNVQ